MTRRRALDETTEAELYREYAEWQDSVRRLHPKKLRAKYGLSKDTFYRYVKRRHKRRAA